LIVIVTEREGERVVTDIQGEAEERFSREIRGGVEGLTYVSKRAPLDELRSFYFMVVTCKGVFFFSIKRN